MKLNIVRALGAVLLVSAVFSAKAAEVTVVDPWVRAGPPNAPALGVFMKLENHTGSDISLVDVRSSLKVDRVELHRTMMADGMMKMMPQVAIPVEAHSATLLKPGSWHIMLISPKKVPLAGESVELTLVFSDGSKREVTAGVRMGTMEMGDNHGMNNMEQTGN